MIPPLLGRLLTHISSHHASTRCPRHRFCTSDRPPISSPTFPTRPETSDRLAMGRDIPVHLDILRCVRAARLGYRSELQRLPVRLTRPIQGLGPSTCGHLASRSYCKALEADLDGDETALLPDLIAKMLYALTYNRQIKCVEFLVEHSHIG